MRKASTSLLLLALPALIHAALPGYDLNREYAGASPGGLGVGLYGYDNPALLTYLHQPDLLFVTHDGYGRFQDFNNWGLFAAAPGLGFGVVHQEAGPYSINDYRITSAVGNRRFGIGLGYGWSSGALAQYGRTRVVTLGALYRPNPFLSLGMSGILATSGGAREGTVDLALRPLGTPLLTLFGDVTAVRGIELEDSPWSAGAVLEVLPGVRLSGRYYRDGSFSAGLNLSLGHAGVQSQAHFSDSADYSYSTYGVRLGAQDRSLLGPSGCYLKLDLKGPMKYQQFRLLDESRTLLKTLQLLDKAADDPGICGIAISVSGMHINVEMLWEIRAKLADFRAAGKHVVLYLDNAGMYDYYLASVADRLVIDPLGMIDFRGVIMGKTYLKGALEKLGIGVDEWRFFTYKSAAEVLSRDRMSDPDREQLQAIVDDAYNVLRGDICDSRSLTVEQYEALVNEQAFFDAHEAMARGLVDTIGRWDKVEELMEQLEGHKPRVVGEDHFTVNALPPDGRWGAKPRIAVIYALGECAMDAGITARRLVKDVEAAMNDPQIKAVVFRVDSPGGDGLASDIVALAIKKCREKKPVVVSQGLVAGSGGYWLSMYGDPIVSSPITLTGSIGVIGVWVYDNGIMGKLGITTDHVKVGEHADMDFGAALPFIGASIPNRNLTPEERLTMEKMIKDMYREFVSMVAAARERGYDDIETVAQGRVWSGLDAKEHDLVDEIGGLDRAIAIAMEKAGIAADAEIDIVELPRPGLMDPGMFRPGMVELDARTRRLIDDLTLRLEHNGKSLPIMPLDQIDMTLD